MSVTSKLQSTMSYSNGTSSLSGSVVDSGANLQTQSNTFAAGSSNAAMTMTLTQANLQSFFLVASQACTVKTNSSSTPQDTFALVAGVPLVWSKSSGLANPFAGNVTAAYVTCTPATTVQYGILQS